jgi:hypothetical protein
VLGVDHELVDALEDALDRTGSDAPTDRALLLVALATELAVGGDHARRLRICDEAAALARVTADPATITHVLSRRFAATWMPETHDIRAADAAECLRLSERIDDPLERATAIGYRMVAALEVADRDTVDESFELIDEVIAVAPIPSLVWGWRMHRAWRTALDGDLDTAAELASSARDVGRDFGLPASDFVYAYQAAALHWAAGTFAEATESLAELDATMPTSASAALLARALCETDPAAARQRLDRAMTDLMALPHDQQWLCTIAVWGECAHQLGDAAAADKVIELLAPWCEQIIFTGGFVFGPVAHAVGLAHATANRPREARRALRRAGQLARSLRSPFFVERSHAALLVL